MLLYNNHPPSYPRSPMSQPTIGDLLLHFFLTSPCMKPVPSPFEQNSFCLFFSLYLILAPSSLAADVRFSISSFEDLFPKLFFFFPATPNPSTTFPLVFILPPFFVSFFPDSCHFLLMVLIINSYHDFTYSYHLALSLSDTSTNLGYSLPQVISLLSSRTLLFPFSFHLLCFFPPQDISPYFLTFLTPTYIYLRAKYNPPSSLTLFFSLLYMRATSFFSTFRLLTVPFDELSVGGDFSKHFCFPSPTRFL